MTRNKPLQQIVLTELAALFNADLNEFTFYTTLPSLPNNENDFSQFLDSLPTGEQIFNPTETVHYFSQIYGQILAAQSTTPFAIEIGLKDYNNKDNWLVPYSIPKTTPSLTDANTSIISGVKKVLTVKSNEQPISIPSLREFPNIIASAPLLDFYNQVAKSNFTTTITFDKAASLTVNFGGWYFSGAFIYAYQNPKNWKFSVISWDDVFNKDTGLLRYINKSIACVSNMEIALNVPGNFDVNTVSMLEAIPNQVIFPFYQQISGSVLSFTLENDQSITIGLKVSEKNNFFFGVQYQSVREMLD